MTGAGLSPDGRGGELHRLIDPDRLVERTAELIRLPSVNPFDGPGDANTGEQSVARWMAEHLDRLGFAPEVTEPEPGRPNVVGTGPGGDGPILALAGHTDTVGVGGYDDPFSATIVDGRIHGRGACDMKGALATFIEVAEVLSAAGTKLDGRLMIAGIADEEHAMLGSRALGASGPLGAPGRPADQIIVGEPTDLRVCTAHKGQYAFTVKTNGRAVHSSLAGQGINAIEHMMEIVDLLLRYRTELAEAEPHPRCGVATVNPGVIRGGQIASMVPDLCELEVDRRLLPGETSAGVEAEIRGRLERLAAGRPDFRWELGPTMIDAPPLETESVEPVVAAALRALEARSRPADPEAFTGATDAPNLGAPAIIWGPGSLQQAHTTDEWLAIDELTDAAHLYLDVCLELLA